MTANTANTGVNTPNEVTETTRAGTSPEITEVAGHTISDTTNALDAAREERAAAYDKVAEFLDKDVQLAGEVVRLYGKNNGILSYKGSEYYFALLGNEGIDYGDLKQGMSVKFTVKQDPRRGFQWVATAFIAELNPVVHEEKEILASKKANHMHMIFEAKNPEMVEEAIAHKKIFSGVIRNVNLGGYGTLDTDGAVVNFDIAVMEPKLKEEVMQGDFMKGGMPVQPGMPVKFTLIKGTAIPRTDNYFIVASIQVIGSTEKSE